MSWLKISNDYIKIGADHTKDLTQQILESIKREPKSWVISATIGAVTFYIAKFYYKVSRYPSGPIPIPLLGNALMITNLKEKNIHEKFADLSKKYGPLYTFWLGSVPSVMICDLDTAKEAFQVRKNDIAGRVEHRLFKDIFDGGTDIVMADYGPTWESLRRVAHAAVRKYAVSEKLPYLVSDVVDETVKLIKEKEGIDSPFEPFNYLYLMMHNILASSAFGKRYTFDDPEIVRLRKITEEIQDPANRLAILMEFLPFLKLFFESIEKKIQRLMNEFFNIIKDKYKSHLNDYESGLTRDFSDALIAAKEEALAEGKESAPYLTDTNLALVLFDLFSAGSDTTQFTLRWALLIMSNYPEIQNKMRKEISDVIGDRMPVQDDRNQCHYVNAFITECLRFRGVAPLGVPHKAICDVVIGEHKIPKNTMVLLNSYAIMMNPNVFPDPLTFKPERFLESDGKYITLRPQGFLTFGMGRRVCLGEKLAIADLFLVLVRLLQATDGHEFALPEGPHSADLKSDPKIPNGCVPKKYKIMIRKLN